RRRRSGTAAGRGRRRAPCRGASRPGALPSRGGHEAGRWPPAAFPDGRPDSIRARRTHAPWPERTGAPSTLRALSRRLLIVTAVFLASAAPARADLVRLQPGKGHELARRAGGTELVHELGIWRLPASAVAGLRRAGVLSLS